MSVLVQVPSSTILVPISSSQSRVPPVFHIKRAVAIALAVDPLQFRLEHADQTIDSVHVPQILKYVPRPKRCTDLQVIVRTPSSSNCVYALKLDHGDTVCDAKFIIGALANALPENLKLFAGGKELGDAESVQALVKAKPETVRVQFTNIDSDGFEVRRAVPNLVSLKDTDKSTMKSLFLEAAGKFKNVNFLGSRAGPQGKYQWQTYGQIAERVNHTIAGLLSLGAVKGDRVALWSINRPEWLIIDIVCCVFGFISVPLYDTLGPSACEYVLNHSEAKFLFVESNKYKEALLLKGKCKSVQHVISMEKDIPDSLSLKSLEAKGVAALKKGLSIQSKIHPSDILSICYTSGTTGDPKGVVISQGNVYSACIAMVEKAAEDLKVPGLVMISYLPLAHIYERVLELGTLALGQSVGYYSGDINKLVDDVAELKPHIFPGVPRVWQRVYDRISGQINESNLIRRSLVGYAFSSKKASLDKGDRSPQVWDKVVFSKIKEKFGGNLKFVSSGAAPLSAKIAEFLIIGLSTDFFEGYGLTETCAVSCISDRYDTTFGHVGSPTACIEIKLVDIPEMDYLTTDKPNPRGEIWLRGPSVFAGYYKNASVTSESITEDGWFKTGDVGLWRSDGNLQIIDRKKNIFKLAQGEYIRPEYIENVYKQSKFVGHIFVYGDSFQQYLVAIVVPSFEALIPWAKSKGLPESPAELIKLPQVSQMILEDMRVQANRENLRGFEEVKKISLHLQEFTVENDMLTPSLKLKRHQAKLKFQTEISKMYGSSSKL